MDGIQKEIDSFYAKYASKEGITLAEAKRRVSKLDMDEYSRKAQKYVADRDFSKQANQEMRLYNLTMKVNRLELLKANIGMELTGGFDEMQKYFEQTLNDRTMEEFSRQAGILGKSIQNNARRAHAIVNASFHNASYSDRIWMHQDLLKAEISKQLERGLIQGKGSRELARELRKTFDVSRSDAERLMTTELRRVQTEAAKQSYERNGNKEYTFLVTNPKGPCEVCKKLDGMHFKVIDMMPGKNAPPMHPRCHCTTAPYWDQEEFDRWLDEENRKMHQRQNAEKKVKTVAKQAKSSIIKLDFSSEELRKKHYEKHKEEFEDLSEDQYIAQANELANLSPSEDVERLTRSDESVSVYRFSTNEFLVITKEGNIRTYFKPHRGADYWREEHERNEKK